MPLTLLYDVPPGHLPYVTSVIVLLDDAGKINHTLGVVAAKSANHAINLLHALAVKQSPALKGLPIVGQQAFPLVKELAALG